MKPIKLLKYCLNVFLILLLTLNAIVVLICLFYFLSPDHDFFGNTSLIPDEINNQPITKNTVWTRTLFGIDVFSSILFIYIIIKIRKLVSLLGSLDLFNPLQQKLLKNIGFLFMGYSILNWIPLLFYKHFIEASPRTVNYGSDDTSSFWFILILGLLFTYMSYAFQEASIHKNENELTV